MAQGYGRARREEQEGRSSLFFTRRFSVTSSFAFRVCGYPRAISAWRLPVSVPPLHPVHRSRVHQSRRERPPCRSVYVWPRVGREGPCCFHSAQSTILWAMPKASRPRPAHHDPLRSNPERLNTRTLTLSGVRKPHLSAARQFCRGGVESESKFSRFGGSRHADGKQSGTRPEYVFGDPNKVWVFRTKLGLKFLPLKMCVARAPRSRGDRRPLCSRTRFA